MASKRKKPKAAKVVSATQERQKSDKPLSQEALIRFNGELVENLFLSQAWQEIVLPLIQESVAGVSGRFTNNRFHHGTLTRDWSGNTPLFLAGYQKGLMDLQNHLHDFVLAKDKLEAQKKSEAISAKAPVYNPFLEEENAS